MQILKEIEINFAFLQEKCTGSRFELTAPLQNSFRIDVEGQVPPLHMGNLDSLVPPTVVVEKTTFVRHGVLAYTSLSVGDSHAIYILFDSDGGDEHKVICDSETVKDKHLDEDFTCRAAVYVYVRKPSVSTSQ